ncbi:MAG: hypothetical protein H0T05_05425 [Acidobacteria bacterium]|nr:hypothetical protein [Acidobacteriota bacterium]MBA3887172.1 hypothetical protein [Acidobacteriota bacterium]
MRLIGPIVRFAGWFALAGCIVELAGRLVARNSALLNLAGAAPEPWLLVALAAIAAVATVAPPAPPSKPGRTYGGAGPHTNVVRLFLLLFAAGLAAQLHFGARLQSDGFYYFAYLRSITFDGDVEFSNDYKLLGLGDKPHLFEPTPTGYAQSAWTIGPAIVWSPFFAAGHAVAIRLNRTNPDVSTNGISFPYRQAVCVAGLFYALLGCWFCYRIAARFYTDRLAATATAITILGSFMIWYIVKEPSMTHAPSMAAVSAFMLGWLSTRTDADGGWARTTRQWAWLGLLAGFMTTIRWQNALFAILPAADGLVMLVVAWRAGHMARVKRTLLVGALFTVCAVIGFLPQMIAWNSIYGSWLAVSPVGPQIRWWDPHLIDILFSSRNGLFSWSPVLYFGAIGMVIFTAGRPALGLPMIASVALMTYFNASVQDWWGSAGFGGRRFDGTIPMFIVGVAAFGAWAVEAARRHPGRVMAAVGALLAAWNLALMSVAHQGIVRIGESVSFGDTSAAQARELHGWFGNPFTYPVSLGFAMRNRVGPSQYDLLGVNRIYGDPLQPYGRIDIGAGDQWVLGTGWHAAERGGDGTTFRWVAQGATLLLPLDHAAPTTLQIRLHAFGFPGATPQALTVLVNGHQLAPLPVGPGWEVVQIDTDAGIWRAGVNRLRFDFTWSARPADVGLGGDPRELAAAVDYVRVVKR